MTTRCRSCNAELIWATTEKGKPIPLDATPVADGNIRLEERSTVDRSVSINGMDYPVVEEIVLTAVPAPYEGEERQGDRYLAHFATCKDTKKWRK
jgi:hypothetical protein